LRVNAEQNEKVFPHLVGLASQRGALLSCTKKGELFITAAKINSAPVGTVIEDVEFYVRASQNSGDGISNNYGAEFNGRNRFQYYEAITSSSRRNKTRVKKQSVDSSVPRARYLTFLSEQSLPGEGDNAALWRRNKAFADALSFRFPVNTWYAPNKKIWEPNTVVAIISPTVGLENALTFLIKKVEFSHIKSGNTAELDLTPTFAYTLNQNIVNPWG
jgi:prophage tail gpP-like protein